MNSWATEPPTSNSPAAISSFTSTGEKLRGEFAIVRIKRGKGNEWLLLKKKDAFAEPGWDPEDHARSVLTGRTQEEIARDLRGPSNDGSARTGYSPIRIFPHAGADRRRELRHRGDDWLLRNQMGRRPRHLSTSITAACAWFPATATRWIANIPSCRSCRITSKPRPRFSTAKSPRWTTRPAQFRTAPEPHQRGRRSAIATLARNIPVVFFAFDLLYLDGHDLRGEPLAERKRLLKEVLKPGDSIRYSGSFRGQRSGPPRSRESAGARRRRRQARDELLRIAPHLRLGEVQGHQNPALSSSADSPRASATFRRPRPGHLRSRQIDMGGQRRHRFRSQDDGNDPCEARAAGDRGVLRSNPTSICRASVTWTRPELVCEVRFSNWTDDGRLRARFSSACVPISIRRNACAIQAEAPERTPLLAPRFKGSDAHHRPPSPEVHESRQALSTRRTESASAIC